jgi:hypothetical protein
MDRLGECLAKSKPVSCASAATGVSSRGGMRKAQEFSVQLAPSVAQIAKMSRYFWGWLVRSWQNRARFVCSTR